jgi:hypothetical protein
MTIVRQRFRQSIFIHDDEGYAVGERPFFVMARGEQP